MSDIPGHLHRPEQQPLDSVERFISEHGWMHERVSENELTVEIDGRWSTYTIWFGWEVELSCVLVSCPLKLGVPDARRMKLYSLLAQTNERLWVGHFDLFTQGDVPVFRHALLIGGQEFPTDEQLADLLEITITECDRFFPAFKCALEDDVTVEDALQAAIIDPVGEA